MDERRRSRRVTLTECIGITINSRVQARVIDISLFGAQLELTSALRPASSCRLAVATEYGQLSLRARVQRCRATAVPAADGHGSRLIYLAGIEFIDVSDEDAQKLRSACLLPLEIAHHKHPTISAPAGNRLTAESIEQLLLAV